MEFKNKQDVFDHVVGNLFKQGKKSIIKSTETCRYRHRGLKCAAGWVIEDDEYSYKMENNDIRYVIEEFGLDHLKKYEVLLNDLQEIHDDVYEYNWIVEFERIAVHHKLKWNF